MCGSGKLIRFVAMASDTSPNQKIHVVECKRCTLAWQFPPSRNTEQSAKFFEEAYRAAADNPSAYFHPDRRRATAAIQIAAINTRVPQLGRILDVGGGNGYFARAAHDAGWETTLADPALDMADFSKAPYRVIRGTADAIESGPFDVITLWDVIEHLPAPTAILRDVVRLLKPGGTLVVETGNYKSVDRVAQGKTHWIYQADHRWYFSPESTVAMLCDFDLVDIDVHPAVMRPNWSGVPHYAGPSRKALLYNVLTHPTTAPAALITYLRRKSAARWQYSGLGVFTVFARKQS